MQPMKDFGYKKGYRYAHDEPDGYAAGENYFPKDLPEQLGGANPVLRLAEPSRYDLRRLFIVGSGFTGPGDEPVGTHQYSAQA